MKMTIDHKQIRNVAVFMTLLYAFTTRSILAKFLFQNQIELLAFYGVTYVCLIVSVIGAFFYDGVHLYAPKGFFSILTLFLVIFYGLIVAHNNYSLLYYGLALLMPFAVFNEIKNTTTIMIKEPLINPSAAPATLLINPTPGTLVTLFARRITTEKIILHTIINPIYAIIYAIRSVTIVPWISGTF